MPVRLRTSSSAVPPARLHGRLHGRRRLRRACVLAASIGVACLLVSSTTARAGRALDEPASLAKTLKAAPKSDVEKALRSANAWDRCKDALDDGFLIGLECRVVVTTSLVRAKPIEKKQDVDARVSLFNDLARVATSISTWDPLTPPPQLSLSRFDAHRAVSKAMMSLYDDVVNANAGGSADVKAAAAAFVKRAPDPKAAACAAAQRSVELATGADASFEERGAVETLITSHSCFLDESRLEKAPTPKALADNQDAKSVAASTSALGAIREYAASRQIDLQRCEDRHISAAGKADDKLEGCVCGAINRWKFPAPGADTDITLPLAASLSVRVSAAANGAIHHCGPVVPSSP